MTPELVRDCFPRTEHGGYWILSESAETPRLLSVHVANSPFPIGAKVEVRDGQLVQVAR